MTYQAEIEAMMIAYNEQLPKASWRRAQSIEHFVQFDRAAAVLVARAAAAQMRARVDAARAALHRGHGGPTEDVNALMSEWRRLADDLRAIAHEMPPEGRITEHAARYLRDPSEANLRNLALFVAI